MHSYVSYMIKSYLQMNENPLNAIMRNHIFIHMAIITLKMGVVMFQG